jgi:hypothetical protein
MHVSIHQQLIDRMPPEHIEALLHYAHGVFSQHEAGSGVLAVVSRGGNVVLFDRAAEKCFVLPLSELRNVPAGAMEKIRQWQSEPSTTYFVMELGGFETPQGQAPNHKHQ